jgi:hypothetical protein
MSLTGKPRFNEQGNDSSSVPEDPANMKTRFPTTLAVPRSLGFGASVPHCSFVTAKHSPVTAKCQNGMTKNLPVS